MTAQPYEAPQLPDSDDTRHAYNNLLIAVNRPQRIHWSRFLGTPLPPTARLITRASRYGNPFTGCEHRTREQAVDQFRQFLHRPDRDVDPSWLCHCNPDRVRDLARRYPDLPTIRINLAGYDLACACQPGRLCHGDVLLELAALPHTIGAQP